MAGKKEGNNLRRYYVTSVVKMWFETSLSLETFLTISSFKCLYVRCTIIQRYKFMMLLGYQKKKKKKRKRKEERIRRIRRKRSCKYIKRIKDVRIFFQKVVINFYSSVKCRSLFFSQMS